MSGTGKKSGRKVVLEKSGRHRSQGRKTVPEDIPPPGVDAELHREIMRRINNRYYDTKDLCSMRRGGAGGQESVRCDPVAANVDL